MLGHSVGSARPASFSSWQTPPDHCSYCCCWDRSEGIGLGDEGGRSAARGRPARARNREESGSGGTEGSNGPDPGATPPLLGKADKTPRGPRVSILGRVRPFAMEQALPELSHPPGTVRRGTTRLIRRRHIPAARPTLGARGPVPGIPDHGRRNGGRGGDAGGRRGWPRWRRRGTGGGEDAGRRRRVEKGRREGRQASRNQP